jgi:hypothetical protein
MPLVNKLGSLPADRSIFQFIREDQFYLVGFGEIKSIFKN